MAFTLVQAGASLKSVNSDGAWSSALALPAGITLATNLRPRFCKFAMGLRSYVVLVNTPTYPLIIDDSGLVRFLSPPAPTAAVAASATGSGVLSGNYLVLQSYFIKDALGNTIAESGVGPAMSAAASLSSQQLLASYAVSPYTVSGTRLYRTLTNGGVYFPWHDVPDNTTASYTGNESDASLSTIAMPDLGTVPDLTLVAEFAGRLWGVSRSDVDHLRYTQTGTSYMWSPLNTLTIPHVGDDAAGVTALAARRDALGVARRDMFLQVTGTDRTNFRPVVVNGGENVGCVSQESMIVWNDVAYFLFRDGVYKWDSNGIVSLTNNLVRSWFTSDAVFNRAMFWRAFAQFDPNKLKYRLFLASSGSAIIDRWIEYDLITGTWWGPHQTDAFTPTCAIIVPGSDQQPYAMVGSTDGQLSQAQEPRNDWDLFPVNFSVTTQRQDGGDADKEKYFGELTLIGKAQPIPDPTHPPLLTVTPTVGEIDNATPQASFTYDMSQGRQRLPRLGVGKQASLQFDQDVIDQDVELYSVIIDPAKIVGRR